MLRVMCMSWHFSHGVVRLACLEIVVCRGQIVRCMMVRQGSAGGMHRRVEMGSKPRPMGLTCNGATAVRLDCVETGLCPV